MKNFTDFLIERYDDEEKLSPLEEAKLRVILDEDAWQKRQKDRNALAKQLSARFGNQDNQIQQPKRSMASVKPTDNVRDVMQGAADDVISPLPRQGAKSKQRAKNLGFGVSQSKITEPQFAQNTPEFDKDPVSYKGVPGLELDKEASDRRQESKRHILDKTLEAANLGDGKSAKAGDLSDHVEHSVNSGGLDGSGKRTRADAPGSSVDKYRDENATLEVINNLHHLGMSVDDPEFLEMIATHFVADQNGNPIKPADRKSKVEAAIKAGQAILEDFRGDGKDIKLGRFGGQQTGIDDGFRDNLYDEVVEKLFYSVGKKRSGKSGTSAAAIRNAKGEGRKEIQGKLFGTEDNPANLKDILQNADIYLTDGNKSDQLRERFNEILSSYESDTDGKISTEDVVKQVTEMLSHAMREGSMTGYSLKEIRKNAPVKMEMLNQSPQSFIKLANAAIRGDIAFPNQWNTQKDSRDKSGLERLTARRNFSFDLLMDAINVADGEESESKEMEAKYSSSTPTKPSKFKLEPFGFGAKMGETPKPIVTQVLQKFAGEGVDDMLPVTSGEDKIVGSKEKDALKIENFSEEQIQYWQDYIEDLVQNPSEKFNLGKSPFSIDGEEMSPSDFINTTLQNFGISDEEKQSGERVLDRGGKPYDSVKSRFETLGMLRNLRMWKALRNADNDGRFDEIVQTIIGGAGKMNTKPEGVFWPKVQVGSG